LEKKDCLFSSSLNYQLSTIIYFMDANFWKQRWEQNDIGFHRTEPNPLLVKFFPELALAPGSRVFLPLCGKSLDIGWLLSRGHRVAGAELSRIAIEQLFAGLGVEPQIRPAGALEHFSAQHLDIFVGDIFALTAETLGAVDAVYDRGALVALPATMRSRYAAHLLALTRRAPQLLVSYDYNQTLMDGPPFAITDAEVQRHYGKDLEARLAASVAASGRMTGQVGAKEKVWILK
jgi:thiopurine S-methyltransferase